MVKVLQSLFYYSYKEFNKVMLQFIIFTLASISKFIESRSKTLLEAWEEEKCIQI